MNFENLLIQNSGRMGIHANRQSSVNLGRMTAIIGNQDDGIHANASSLKQWGDDGDYLLVKDNWGRGIGLWRGGEGEFNNVHVENNGHGGDASNPDLNKEQGIHVNWNATVKLQGGYVINSGRDGLGVYGSSVAWIRNNFRFADNARDGISVDAANLEIESALIENNGNTAINLGKNATADLRNVNLSNHEGGISAWLGSAFTADNITVFNSTYQGIGLAGAKAYLRNITVENSGGHGILATKQSHLFLVENISLLGNSGGGVYLNSSSMVYDNQNNERSFLIENNKSHGIAAHDQAAVSLAGQVQILGNESDGIHAEGSSIIQRSGELLVKDNWGWGVGVWSGGEARLENVYIENNGHGDPSDSNARKEQGVHANWNATVRLGGGHIKNSGNGGMVILSSSAAAIYNGFEISGNNNGGINVIGSDLSIEDSTVSNNSGDGISGGRNSRFDIRRTKIQANVGSGINVRRNAYLMLDSSEVSQNQGEEGGIHLSRNSHFDLQDSTISNNVGHGINVSNNSLLDIWSASTITSNGGDGIRLFRDVYFELDGPVTVSGNTGRSLSMGEGTSLAGNPSNLGVDSEVSCWSGMWRDPNDPDNPDKNQYGDFPILDLWNDDGSALPPISSNCRVNANF